MKKNWLTCVLIFFSFGHGFAQAGKELETFIRHNVDSIFSKENPPGIVVGILHNGQRDYFSAGFADPDKQMRFDSATLFEIGSITKTFTAYVLTAVLMENNIADTGSIIKYLPDSVQQNKQLEGISFLSLMNHTSGLPRLPGNMKMDNARQPYALYSSTELFACLKTCMPRPDGKSNYSNLGAGLAGVLAERISGRSYAALLDTYIFLPFNIVTPANGIEQVENKSQGYYGKNDKTAYWNMNILAPAGGLKCSASEMLTYLQNMCFPVSANAKQVVEKITTQTIAINPRIAVARGWHIYNENEQPLFYWHNGGTYGFSTFCAFTKDKSRAVIIAINQFSKNALADGLGMKIIRRLVSEP